MAPILILEAVGTAGTHGVHVINCEALTCNVEYFFVRVCFFEMVAYCLYEMRLAMPRRAVDEKRVVHEPWSLKNGFGGGMCKLVERTDYKSFESISRIQIITLVDIEGREVKSGLRMRGGTSWLGAFASGRSVYHILNSSDGAIKRTQGLENRLSMFFHKPLLDDF